jgi:hypothetical protein
MARPIRLEFGGALYHVTARGDRREAIYEDDAGREVLDTHFSSGAYEHPTLWAQVGVPASRSGVFPASILAEGRAMTVKSAPPSPQALAMLKALQAAVARNLEKKQKLGEYIVIWQNGRPLQTGADAPKTTG